MQAPCKVVGSQNGIVLSSWNPKQRRFDPKIFSQNDVVLGTYIFGSKRRYFGLPAWSWFNVRNPLPFLSPPCICVLCLYQNFNTRIVIPKSNSSLADHVNSWDGRIVPHEDRPHILKPDLFVHCACLYKILPSESWFPNLIAHQLITPKAGMVPDCRIWRFSLIFYIFVSWPMLGDN